MEAFPSLVLLPSSLLPHPSNLVSLFLLCCFFLRGLFRATGAFRAFPASACHRSHLLSLAFRSLFILERLGLVLKYRDLFFHLRYLPHQQQRAARLPSSPSSIWAENLFNRIPPCRS